MLQCKKFLDGILCTAYIGCNGAKEVPATPEGMEIRNVQVS